MDFKALCILGHEFKVTDLDVRLAAMRKGDTGGLLLVSCSQCGSVYYLDPTVPSDPTKIDQWIATLPPEDENWLACIPLEGVVAVEPLGGGIEMPPGSGRKFYKPGDGETVGYPDGYPRWVYMYLKGLDPEVAWQLMKGKGSQGNKPIRPVYVIGAEAEKGKKKDEKGDKDEKGEKKES